MLVRIQQAHDAIHQVVHVAEGARLLAVAVDGERLSEQGLLEEVGQGAAVLQVHARAVGVEDAHDARIHAVKAVVGHRQRLGETLGLVVDGAPADGIHVACVILGLGMDQRVAVDFTGGSQQVARLVCLCHAEGIVRAKRARLHGLDGQVEIPGRRLRVGAGRGGEMQDRVHFAGYVDVIGNVVFIKREFFVSHQVRDVLAIARDEIVQPDDCVFLGNQSVAQVGAEKTCGSGD